MEIDLHGYRPRDIVFNGVLEKIVQQAWEMGEAELKLIHGHGHTNNPARSFVNTNTGYLGREIRRTLRHETELRKWIKYTTLKRSHEGSTSVKLKANPNPNRTEIDCMPTRTY